MVLRSRAKTRNVLIQHLAASWFDSYSAQQTMTLLQTITKTVRPLSPSLSLSLSPPSILADTLPLTLIAERLPQQDQRKLDQARPFYDFSLLPDKRPASATPQRPRLGLLRPQVPVRVQQRRQLHALVVQHRAISECKWRVRSVRLHRTVHSITLQPARVRLK